MKPGPVGLRLKVDTTDERCSEMNRARLAVIAGVAMLVLGVGVAVVATQDSSNNRAAADTAAAVNDTVSVSGTGSVEGVPDTLVANLRVHSTVFSSVQDALNATATNTRAVITKLTDKGVKRADIKTTDLSLNPHYDSHGNQDGYDSSESLRVRISPLTKVGEILSAVAPASTGNSVSINGLSFDIADNSTLLDGARAAAFNNAKAAAEQYAKLGGRTLDHVVSIKAQVHNASPIYASAGAPVALDSFKGRAAVPIRPGQKKISVTVKVIWALS
jgi:uncharacterized protein YggE